MPTYQYACTNPDGKHDFELVQSFTDEPASECPTCGSSVRKVYGSVGVVFKGSGFYRNDSRDTKAAASKTSDSSKSSSSDSSGSDSSGKTGDSSKSSTTPSASSSDAKPVAAAAG